MVRYCACVVHSLLEKTKSQLKVQSEGGEPVLILLRRRYCTACGQASPTSLDWDSQEACKQSALVCHDAPRSYKLPVCWMREHDGAVRAPEEPSGNSSYTV